MELMGVYITGDTMVFDDIKDIPKRYPEVDVALFHLGGTTVLGIVVTMDAKEGLEMFRIINPKKVIPIHYNDYDVFKSPLSDFKEEIERLGEIIKMFDEELRKNEELLEIVSESESLRIDKLIENLRQEENPEIRRIEFAKIKNELKSKIVVRNEI